MLNIYLIFYTHQIFRGAFNDDLNTTQPNSRKSYYLREYQEVAVSLRLLQRSLLVFQRVCTCNTKACTLLCCICRQKDISEEKGDISIWEEQKSNSADATAFVLY